MEYSYGGLPPLGGDTVIVPLDNPQFAGVVLAVAARPAARFTLTVSIPKISTVGSSIFS